MSSFIYQTRLYLSQGPQVNWNPFYDSSQLDSSILHQIKLKSVCHILFGAWCLSIQKAIWGLSNFTMLWNVLSSRHQPTSRRKLLSRHGMSCMYRNVLYDSSLEPSIWVIGRWRRVFRHLWEACGRRRMSASTVPRIASCGCRPEVIYRGAVHLPISWTQHSSERLSLTCDTYEKCQKKWT